MDLMQVIPHYEGQFSPQFYYCGIEALGDLAECFFYVPYFELRYASKHINQHGFSHITLTIL